MKTSLHEWPQGTPDYTTHDVMKNYIQEVTHLFKVHEHIRFQTNVLELKKGDSAWNVRTKSRNRHEDPESPESLARDEQFDAVVVATGHYHAPRVPNIAGLAELKRRHPALISHSKGFRGAKHLAGKNVLLIGTSASAIDIARDAFPVAKKVYHSGRGGQFDVPLSFFPEGITHVGEVINIEPRDEDDGSDLHAKFHLAEGSSICDLDAVILCTGYLISLPFLREYHDDEMPVDQASENVIITNGFQYHNLHKDIFYIPDPSLAFVGVPYFSANFSLFDFQAQVVAAVLSGLATLPPEAELRQEYNDKLASKGAGKQFHSLKGTEVDYVNELLDWVNPQLEKNGKPALKGHTAEWLAARDEQYALFKEIYGGVKAEYVPQITICS
jgi:lysine/ornithine N-monooxygenase